MTVWLQNFCFHQAWYNLRPKRIRTPSQPKMYLVECRVRGVAQEPRVGHQWFWGMPLAPSNSLAPPSMGLGTEDLSPSNLEILELLLWSLNARSLSEKSSNLQESICMKSSVREAKKQSLGRLCPMPSPPPPHSWRCCPLAQNKKKAFGTPEALSLLSGRGALWNSGAKGS